MGAGHNGLAAGLVLARNGRKVLVLEKNNYVGGMGGTREILKGCRNEVGASCLFPLSAEIKQYFDFESHTYSTTIAQLNFIYFVETTGILSYVTAHMLEVEKSMNTFVKNNKILKKSGAKVSKSRANVVSCQIFKNRRSLHFDNF